MDGAPQTMAKDAAMTAEVRVRAAGPGDAAAWDAYLAAHDDATIFHRFHWASFIEDVFGHKAVRLIAERGDGAAARIVGVLGLTHKRSLIFGTQLISPAFGSYGGAVAEDEAAARVLEDAAAEAGAALGVECVEFRNKLPRRDDFVRKDGVYVTFRKELAATDEEILKSIARKGRKSSVKQGLKRGYAFDEETDFSAFYKVMSESYRNLGTPIFPKRYFEAIRRYFPEETACFVVRDEGAPLAATLTLFYKDEAHPLYTGGTAASRKTPAVDFLYYRLFCETIARGFTHFDFGRSKAGTGNASYKSHWGFDEAPLNYEYKLIKGDAIPDANPNSPKYALFVNGWKRMPLWAAEIVGPHLIREIG